MAGERQRRVERRLDHVDGVLGQAHRPVQTRDRREGQEPGQDGSGRHQRPRGAAEPPVGGGLRERRALAGVADGHVPDGQAHQRPHPRPAELIALVVEHDVEDRLGGVRDGPPLRGVADDLARSHRQVPVRADDLDAARRRGERRRAGDSTASSPRE